MATKTKEVLDEATAKPEEIAEDTAEATPQDAKGESAGRERRVYRKRIKNREFFSQDVLGRSVRNGLEREVTLVSQSARNVYRLTFDLLDSYLHRQKEYMGIISARDKNSEMQKLIDSRLTELEKFVESRYKQVKKMYDAATAMEKYEFTQENTLVEKAKFSTHHSNRFLAVIERMDEVATMAEYLEIMGGLDMRQEQDATTSVYNRVTMTARTLILFIARTIRAIRSDLRMARRNSEESDNPTVQEDKVMGQSLKSA